MFCNKTKVLSPHSFMAAFHNNALPHAEQNSFTEHGRPAFLKAFPITDKLNLLALFATGGCQGEKHIENTSPGDDE